MRSRRNWSRERLRRRVANCLRNCEAASEVRLVDRLGARDHRTVRRALLSLVNDGEVEVLTPVGGGRSGVRRPALRDRVYYRLVRPTDRAFLWEQDLECRAQTA